MKRLFTTLVVLGLGVVFVGTLGFLWWKAQEAPEVFETGTAFMADIEKKTVATGSIVPRNEVAIKSRVSGVVTELHMEPGELTEQGDLIASIQVIPDEQTLTNAEATVRSARITANDAERALARARTLADQGAISAAELERAGTTHDLAQQDLSAATTRLTVVREGARRGTGQVNTEVRSTVTGMVLAADVKVGQSVIESNTFNEGTTIASVADMSDMIFLGFVDETEVGKVREGMPLVVTVGALEGVRLDGTLEYISPKGTNTNGAVQFEIKAAVKQQEGVFLRAGVSANANIVLDKRSQVLAINEADLVFDKGEPFVDVEIGPQEFERRAVQVGLSDGMTVEIVGGIEADTPIKTTGG
ncbi:MAG: HlyD family secretion protein [Myxococcota bacterium]|jgi:HlyD family secretion protein